MIQFDTHRKPNMKNGQIQDSSKDRFKTLRLAWVAYNITKGNIFHKWNPTLEYVRIAVWRQNKRSYLGFV